MWYNATLRQLQSNPPWQGWISEEAKAQYTEWQEVANDFVMPKILLEEQNKKWSEVKAKREEIINSPIEYLGKLFDFDEKGARQCKCEGQADNGQRGADSVF